MKDGRAGPLFADDGAGGRGSGFETIGSGGGMRGRGAGADHRRDGRFTRIVCDGCGMVIGMALHGANGPAYCGDCWEKLGDGGGSGGDGARGPRGGGGDCIDDGNDSDADGAGRGSGEETGAGGDGKEAGREHGGALGEQPSGAENGGDGGEQVRRMRALMRSLADGDGGRPTRRQVLDGMLLDGGGGAWTSEEAAEWCLDNALRGIVYEPEAGRLSLIDGD